MEQTRLIDELEDLKLKTEEIKMTQEEKEFMEMGKDTIRESIPKIFEEIETMAYLQWEIQNLKDFFKDHLIDTEELMIAPGHSAAQVLLGLQEVVVDEFMQVVHRVINANRNEDDKIGIYDPEFDLIRTIYREVLRDEIKVVYEDIKVRLNTV